MIVMEYREGIVITATELKKNLGKYLETVENQQDIIITKNNNKVARLTPYVTDAEHYFALQEKAHDYAYGGKKVSYEEFMIINEKSTLRMEFINGEIVLLASPSTVHQTIIGRLYIIFSKYLERKKCKVFFAPFDVHFKKININDPDVMQPDIFIVCDMEGNVNDKDRYMGTPSFVVEILSRATRRRDIVDKLNTYMLSGVHEYWVIDPIHKQLFQYTFEDRDLNEFNTFNVGNIVSVYFNGLSVNLTELFADEIFGE